MLDSSGFITESGCPGSMIGKYWTSKGVNQAFICTKDRVVLDYFTATNGVYYPADSAAVRDANTMNTEMYKLIREDSMKTKFDTLPEPADAGCY